VYSSKLWFVINFLSFLLFTAAIVVQVMEVQYYGVPFGNLFN
jgi:hypothetical protein